MTKGLWFFLAELPIVGACVYSISTTVGRSPGEWGFLIPLMLLLVTPPLLFGFGFYYSWKEKEFSGNLGKYLNAAGLLIYVLWITGALGFILNPAIIISE